MAGATGNDGSEGAETVIGILLGRLVNGLPAAALLLAAPLAATPAAALGYGGATDRNLTSNPPRL